MPRRWLQPILFNGWEPIEQRHRLGKAPRIDGPRLGSTQQHLGGPLPLAQAFQVARQQIQGRARHRGAVLPPAHRQLKCL